VKRLTPAPAGAQAPNLEGQLLACFRASFVKRAFAKPAILPSAPEGARAARSCLTTSDDARGALLIAIHAMPHLADFRFLPDFAP
jgi:hypothetical protein